MTEHDPTMRFPGEFEPRRRVSITVVEAPGGPGLSTTVPAGLLGTGPLPRDSARSAERPMWVKASMFLGVLFALMFLVMWGASIAGK